MKTIKLTKGFLVFGWTGQIEEIQYFKINYLHYGNSEEKIIAINKKEEMLEPIGLYSSDKVFDEENKAISHSRKVKQDKIKYYQKQVKENQERVDSLLKEATEL